MKNGSSDLDLALVLCPTWTADKPPVGLAVLKAYLARHGIESRIVDFNARFYRRVEAELPRWKGLWGSDAWQIWQDYNFFPFLFPDRFPYADPAHEELAGTLRRAARELARELVAARPRAVGFSLMANTTLMTLFTAQELRAMDPDLPLIYGGPNCGEGTNDEFFARSGLADAVVTGEGEETLLELLRPVLRGEPMAPVPGTVMRVGDELVRGGTRKMIRRMDGLPAPDYRGLDESLYINGFRELDIEFSRGCVVSCDFCFDRPFWGGYRCRSGQAGADLVTELHERHGTREFFWVDLTLNGIMKRIDELCEAIQRSGLDVSWGGNARVHPEMDEARLRRMKDAGCSFLHYGLEHASDDVLVAMDKKATQAEYVRALDRAQAAGLIVTCGFVVGHPAETERDFEVLYDFVARHGSKIHQVHANDMALIRGAPIWNNREVAGVVPGRGMPLPDDLAWARSYTYPFDTEWTTVDGTNHREMREARVARIRELLEEIDRAHSLHGDGRDELYEAS